ncbi:MAG: TonB-dependent receptor [Marinilabiliaceae bacterium]|nr:TonB-dependent receptor [Marinilabiliaceae bacterium]
MKYQIILILSIFFATEIISQNTINGNVYEIENGQKQPITGANVYWDGTTLGVVTNHLGEFEIPIHTNSNKLAVSFVGYTTKIIEIKENENHIEIILTENIELEEVNVSSRQSGTHISRTNPFTTVQVTSAELCKAACCSLAESFETNASVDVSYTDAVTGAKQIHLLGLSGKYVQMLSENMTNSRGLASSFGMDFVPGQWMESIQISKGAASVLNGYESLTGQINLEYKKPPTSELFFLNGFISSELRMEANANGSIIINDSWSTAILAHTASDMLKVDHDDDGFLDKTNITRYSFINRWYFKPNDQWIGQFGIKYLDEQRTGGQFDFDRKKSLYDIYGNRVASPDIYGIMIDSKNIEAFLKWGYIFSNDNAKSVAILTNYVGHEQESMYGHRFYSGKQNFVSSSLILQSHFGDREKHRYNAGLSFMYDDLNESFDKIGNVQQNQFIPEIVVPNGNRTEKVPGAFFQYTFEIHDLLTIITGLRGDYHNIYGTLPTTRMHIRYNITESTTARASVGNGYRTPHIMAEYNPLMASSRKMIFTENLKIEEGWNYGANITQYFPLGARELIINFEYYRTHFVNQLIVDFDQNVREVLFYNLNGKSYSNVFQIEANIGIVRGLELIAAWRLNDVKTTTAGKLQTKAFQNQYKGLLTTSYSTPLQKWQFDFTAQFNGAGRVPSTAVNPAEHTRPDKFDPYQIYNAQITKNFKNWSFYVGSENIGNFTQHHPIIDGQNPFSEYFDSSLVWGPLMGTKFYFGFRYSIDR